MKPLKPLFPHQKKYYLETRDKEYFAYDWEMRCGKNLPNLMTAMYLYLNKRIDAAVIIAPGDVPLNWSRIAIMDDLEHCEEYHQLLDEFTPLFKPKTIIFEWQSSKANGKGYQEKLEELLKFDGLIWFCINTEALATKNAEKYLEKFFKGRKVMMINDEAHKFKNPDAKCTKDAMWLAEMTKFRRNLTGTPVPKGAFDLWSQYRILNKFIFSEMNAMGQKVAMKYTSFKTRYGIFERKRYGAGPWHDELKEYRDLDHLYSIIEPHRSRLTRKELGMDIPPQYEKRIFKMAPHQQKVYDQLKEELRVQLQDGTEITALQAVTALLRLQQISRGFVGERVTSFDEAAGSSHTEQKIHDLGGPYPSIQALLSIVEQVEGKIVIWCKFTADVELILKTFDEEKISYVRCDGKVSKEDRRTNLDTFYSDTDAIRCLVGTPSAGGIGTDMSCASTMVFYSHSYNYAEWEQALARIQGVNQKSKDLLVIDLVCLDSIDDKCLEIRENKKDLASILTGDKLKEILG